MFGLQYDIIDFHSLAFELSRKIEQPRAWRCNINDSRKRHRIYFANNKAIISLKPPLRA
jgi:hypothetical protein